jgi:8-oxo-dGTP pyrophosphatase MutT (NUDIX family)
MEKISSYRSLGTPKVQKKEEELIYQDRNQRFSKVKASFDGFTKDFVVVEYGPRVALLVVKGDEVLLVRQYRLLIDKLSWEIPGGAVDAGESKQEAAHRECFEESGVRCGASFPLIEYQPGLDVISNPTTVFHSRDILEIADPELKPEEVVQVAWVPLAQCLKMIRAGEIMDALTMIALLAYTRMTEEGQVLAQDWANC